ncbi:MAG: glycosyltransferase [Candidatus Wallbacteria bacterium]|nr:glycosyltransferase [Candidatus Wallbacteria bacterium]
MQEHYELLFSLLFGLYLSSLFGSFAWLLLYSLFKPEPSFRAPEQLPKVSIIVPACNEENVIAEKIANCLELTDGPLEVIIISDGSTDRTWEILKKFSNKVTIFQMSQRCGKPTCLNKGAELASGEILVFTDASVILRQDAIRELMVPFTNPLIGIVFGRIEFDRIRYSSLSKGESAYWGYENLHRILQNCTGFVYSVIGGLCAVRKNLYQPLPEDAVSDDLHLAFNIYRQSFLGYYLPEVLGFEEHPKSTQAEFMRKIRVIAGGWQFFFRHFPDLRGINPFQFFLQKPMRWCSPFFLTALLIFCAATYTRQWSFITLTIAAIMASLPFIELLLRFLYLSLTARTDIKVRWFFLPFYFIMINLASLLGLLQFFLGRRNVLWRLNQR